MVQLPVEIILMIGSYLSVYDAISLVQSSKDVHEGMCDSLENVKRQRYELIDRKLSILSATEANPTDEMLELYLEYQIEYNMVDSQIDTLMSEPIGEL